VKPTFAKVLVRYNPDGDTKMNVRQAYRLRRLSARRGGRTTVGCIVLGRGSDEHAVVRWLTIAAGVHGFIGFAVGRTTWLDAVMEWREHAISREIAVTRIAERFREWAAIFEHVPVR
jgi:myo-inositol catabolism protein IolC